MKIENWKATAFMGFVFAVGAYSRYMWTGNDIPSNVLVLVLGCLGIAGGWQGVKRATTFKPEEVEQAAKMKQEREAANHYGGGIGGCWFSGLIPDLTQRKLAGYAFGGACQ